MATNYAPPDFQRESFHCPACHVYSHQTWCSVQAIGPAGSAPAGQRIFEDGAVRIAVCAHCDRWSFWVSGELAWPETMLGQPPHADMPEEIRVDYEEARAVLARSPRAAAALLRLVLQKLCAYVGKPGKNLNDDIRALVADGIPIQIQQALDVVRVIGNESVHPGLIDLRDDRETVAILCTAINAIVAQQVSAPLMVSELYARLPPEKLEQIQRRDQP